MQQWTTQKRVVYVTTAEEKDICGMDAVILILSAALIVAVPEDVKIVQDAA
jgi:hypothetical protein